jgi:VWFA-related protein
MRLGLCAAVLALIVTGGKSTAQQPQRPLFRASADAVFVDVAVRVGNTIIDDLTAADFALWDQGVRQEIRAIANATVPLDVTLVVDISRSRASDLARFKSDVRGVPALMQRDDRVRLLAFSNDVTQIFGFKAGPPAALVDEIRTGSWGAVNEALAAALIHQVDPDRRHLVVAFTDALDNISLLSVYTVQAIARRASALLHLVIPRDNRHPMSILMESNRTTYGDPFPVLLATEGQPRYKDMIIESAEITGGQVHATGGLLRGGASILGPLKQILNEYRRSYLLQYQPTGVAREGWHEVKVEVTRPGKKYSVRARRGYFIETPP